MVYGDQSRGFRVRHRNRMENEPGIGYSKSSELIDVCMNALKEEERVSQVFGHLQSSTPTVSDYFASSSLGAADLGVGTMRPFYPSCERNLSDRSGYCTTPHNMVITDSSGDEAFAAEMLSPIDAPAFNIGDASSSVGWSNQPEDFTSSYIQLERGQLVEDASVQASCSTSAHPQQARCSKVTRRFLSSETIGSVLHCRYKERADFHVHENRDSINFVNERGIMRETMAGGSSLADASESFSYNTVSRDNANRKPLGKLERSYEQASACSVLREIDMAVSIAQSCLKFDGSEISKQLSPRQETPTLLPVRPSSATAQGNKPVCQRNLSDLDLSEHCVDFSMNVKNKSFNSLAISGVNDWRQNNRAMIALEQNQSGQARNRTYRECQIGYGSPDGSEVYPAVGTMTRVSCDVREPVSSESARRETSTLRSEFEPKINSVRDERKTTSYVPDAPRSSSLLFPPAQSLVHSSSWPQNRSPVYKEEVRNRSGGKIFAKRTNPTESDNKPVNLCLQQDKNRDVHILPVQTAQKPSREANRKHTKSFSVRQRPYQCSKRRTRSQCSEFDAGTSTLNNPSREYDPARPDIRGEVSTCDMGIDNRSALESYKDNAFIGGQGSTSDVNLGALFSTSDSSHMMVQDDMKTYAVLSGRCNEELSNQQGLSSNAVHQQQSPYHQARHSHSIINYVGPHGQSPDVRGSDLSPSPPVRDQRTPSSVSMGGLVPSSKAFPNVIVAHRQHHATISPQQDDIRSQDTFHRPYESSNLFEIHDARQHQHHQPQQQASIPLGHHPGNSSFAPLQLSPHQQQHHQQASQYLMKHQPRRDFYDISSHSGLVTPGSMAHYSGSLQVSQAPHGSYLKPPPVDLDELSDEERERMRVKRERNRVAAAKCRNRRRELLERLEKEAEQLEREQELLRENVRRLRVQKLQLGSMLEEHEPSCHKKLSDEGDTHSPRAEQGVTSKNEPTISTERGNRGKSESPAQHSSSPQQVTTQA